MTMTIATFGPARTVEDAVAEVASVARDSGLRVAVGSHNAAPLGARQDAVPLGTPAVRGVGRGPAHYRRVRGTTVMD